MGGAVEGKTASFRTGLRAISRTEQGVEERGYYEAETETLKRFAEKYQYRQGFSEFDDAHKERITPKIMCMWRLLPEGKTGGAFKSDYLFQGHAGAS